LANEVGVYVTLQHIQDQIDALPSNGGFRPQPKRKRDIRRLYNRGNNAGDDAARDFTGAPSPGTVRRLPAPISPHPPRFNRAGWSSLWPFGKSPGPFVVEKIDLHQELPQSDKDRIAQLFDPGRPVLAAGANARMNDWFTHRDTTRIWVSRDKDNVIRGYVWADFNRAQARAEIQGMGVDILSQGNGMMTDLLQTAMEELSEMREINLIAAYDNSEFIDGNPENGRITGHILTKKLKAEHRFRLHLRTPHGVWYNWVRPRYKKETQPHRLLKSNFWLALAIVSQWYHPITLLASGFGHITFFPTMRRNTPPRWSRALYSAV
jgi:hypothetical protein